MRTERWVIILSVMIPLGLWVKTGVWTNWTTVMVSLGQAAALAGYILLLWNFILAAKYRFLEKWFGGLPKIYRTHHQIGRLAFILLLGHPILLVSAYWPVSQKAALRLIVPSLDNIPIALGRIALVTMILLLVITFWGRLKYDLWKTTHKYLRLVLILGLGHAFLIGSTIGRVPELKAYMLAITIMALYSAWYEPKKRFYTVSKIKNLNSQVVELTLKPDDDKPVNFIPGQFVFVNSHPFSIVSDPKDRQLVLAIKKLGDFTAGLERLKINDKLKVSNPYGMFGQNQSQNKKQLWIAGGIGITPFVGMVRGSLRDDVVLIYSVRNSNEALYGDVFEKVSKDTKYFHHYLHESDKKGRITIDEIINMVPDMADREIYICGPGGMMKDLKKQLMEKGILGKDIYTEEFSLG